MLIAAIIFIITLVLVIWQPRGLGIGWSALIGAALALACGAVHWSDIPTVWSIVWNATATFIAIIIISLVLDEAGTFEWVALHVARWGQGHGLRLFTLIILLGAAVSALFANDGAALILTPIVIAMLSALGFSAAATLAFVMAAGFIADSASLPLLISNLVNIVSADFFKISFNEYAAVMIGVNIVSIAASLLMLGLVFARFIPRQYSLQTLKLPCAAIRDPVTFRASGLILILLMSGFFITAPYGIPISLVAGLAAALILLIARKGKVIPIARVIRGAPWQIVLFSLGMYLVVYGLRNAGLTHYLSQLLTYFASTGIWGATLGTGWLSALLASLMNNLPTVLIGALSIEAAPVEPSIREAMIYANVIGSDLGPKITPIGSLATLLWLHVLAKKNIHISWGYYFKVGTILTVPVLTLSLCALALRLSLVN